MNLKSLIIQKYQNNMINELFTKLLVCTLAFLLPLYTSFLIIGALVISDTILALLSNHKKGIKFCNKEFDLFFYKTIVYMLVLVITHAVSEYFVFDSALIIKTITSVIVIKELNSIDRNVESIIGFSTFKFLIKKINDFFNTNK